MTAGNTSHAFRTASFVLPRVRRSSSSGILLMSSWLHVWFPI